MLGRSCAPGTSTPLCVTRRAAVLHRRRCAKPGGWGAHVHTWLHHRSLGQLGAPVTHSSAQPLVQLQHRSGGCSKQARQVDNNFSGAAPAAHLWATLSAAAVAAATTRAGLVESSRSPAEQQHLISCIAHRISFSNAMAAASSETVVVQQINTHGRTAAPQERGVSTAQPAGVLLTLRRHTRLRVRPVTTAANQPLSSAGNSAAAV
jgi:hypothetical protein